MATFLGHTILLLILSSVALEKIFFHLKIRAYIKTSSITYAIRYYRYLLIAE